VTSGFGRRALLLGAVATSACSRDERGERGERGEQARLAVERVGREEPPRATAASTPAEAAVATPSDAADVGNTAGPAQSSAGTTGSVRLLEWDFGMQPWGQARAVVVVPTWGSRQARFPVLVALHGQGEAQKAPAEGAMGWPRDYAMLRAIDRLRSPPLRSTDYEGFADPARIEQTNTALAARPFRGLIVVCPWLPDFHRPLAAEDIVPYAQFLVEALLPRVQRETPALDGSVGIDGVSLGGVSALRIGLGNPRAFAAVGGIQPALTPGQNAEWVSLALSARAAHPGIKLRLLTSREDYFRESITSLSRAWYSRGIAHDFAEVPGPHDYAFNRGPGSLELLFWHDRALQA
jgi:enterochelin esterase-like enzyme